MTKDALIAALARTDVAKLVRDYLEIPPDVQNRIRSLIATIAAEQPQAKNRPPSE